MHKYEDKFYAYQIVILKWADLISRLQETSTFDIQKQ